MFALGVRCKQSVAHFAEKIGKLLAFPWPSNSEKTWPPQQAKRCFLLCFERH